MTSDADWDAVPEREKADRLAAQAACGHPDAPTTSGLIAFAGGEPAGWLAVEPRTAYPRLLRARTPWAGREEDRADDSVWTISCFVIRVGFRRRGIAAALARAAVDFAREHGARAVEGYPRLPAANGKASAAELYVGTVGVFERAGLVEVSRPGPRRAVMRADFR